MDDAKLLELVKKEHPSYTWEFVYRTPNNETLVITALRPMKSAAGHYAGRIDVEVNEKEEKVLYMEPYSRESDYYPTKEALLKDWEDDMIVERDCDENNHAKEVGGLPK